MSVSTPDNTEQHLPLIGISSCLLGEKVRFDGGHKQNAYIQQTLGNYFRFRPFCPEVAIGLGIPRPTIKLVGSANGIICVDSKTGQKDFTRALQDSAEQQRDWHSQLRGYIFKKDSPSCGMERVKVQISADNPYSERNGRGIYAATFMDNFPLIPTEEEGRLGDPGLRENFIQRVYIYHRWCQLRASGLSKEKLFRFHSQHKLIVMSHHQNSVRQLGRLLAESQHNSIDELGDEYIAMLTQALAAPASRANHVNTLEHIRGYLKNDLDSDDKQELTETLAQYRQGHIPLIVPITLLRHHFRRQPDPFIEQSLYMHPYPAEMQLLNAI